MNELPKSTSACPDYADRLIDFSDGELPPSARQAVAAHVATCEACRTELGRLNRSLTALRSGIIAKETIHLPHERPLARRVVLIGIGCTAAAIVLAIGIASLPHAPANGRVAILDNASITDIRPPHAPSPLAPADGHGIESGSLTTDDVLRRIALLEEQARLETSLALMPDDPWFTDQRAANEELLSTFRKATLAAGAVDLAPHQAPVTKGTL